MGNLSSCIAEHREDRDYLYLERRPPALIAGYETLSHMYYAHARMAIVHLNNDTGHYLKLKVKTRCFSFESLTFDFSGVILT